MVKCNVVANFSGVKKGQIICAKKKYDYLSHGDTEFTKNMYGLGNMLNYLKGEDYG